MITGEKVGNEYISPPTQCTIDYEQERDRSTIHKENVNAKSTIDRLGIGTQYAKGTRANGQKAAVQYRSIPDSISYIGKFVFRPSFQIARLAQAEREFGRAVDDGSNTVIKIPAVLPLAALLDGHRGGNDLSVVNQSHLLH